MKDNLLHNQISWFTPFQEENFITIYEDIPTSTFATCTFHYFIPHFWINDTKQLDYIMTPPSELKEFISIKETKVLRSDIYIVIDVSLPIDWKYQDKRFNNGISDLLLIASKYLNQLSTRTGKRIKWRFPEWADTKAHKELMSIIKSNKWLVKIPAITIGIDSEYDMSINISVNKSEKSILNWKKEKINSILKKIEDINVLICTDQSYFDGLEGDYYKITALSEYITIKWCDVRYKQNIFELSKALNKTLKKI